MDALPKEETTALELGSSAPTDEPGNSGVSIGAAMFEWMAEIAKEQGSAAAFDAARRIAVASLAFVLDYGGDTP